MPADRADTLLVDGQPVEGRPANGSLDSLERGLDVLTTAAPARTSRHGRLLGRVLPPFIAVGLALLVWQLVFWAEVKPAYTFPSPAMVWTALADQWASGALPRAIWLSVSRALLGFAASVAIGTPLGLLGAVPSIANGTISGVDQVPPLYLRVGRVLGARGLRAAWHIVLPAALPGYLGGLKQGWAFAWRSLMAAELITQAPRLGTGLGQLLDAGRQLADISLVFGMILAILAVGVAIDQLLFSPLERGVLRRRGLLAG
jgi:NitT/TauT family transport system permease protein